MKSSAATYVALSALKSFARVPGALPQATAFRAVGAVLTRSHLLIFDAS